MMRNVVTDAPRPLLRGWSHAVAIVPAFMGAVALVVVTRNEPGKQLAVAVYGAALTMLFTVSALYHRVRWSPRSLAVWRRIDHANIFVVIAATYTPIVVTVLDGWLRAAVLTAIWIASLTGATLVAAPLHLPRPAAVCLYLAVGWLAVFITPALYIRLGVAGLSLIVCGGVLYSLGATAYALQRPRLWPRVFGYHEVFHLLVVAASAIFFTFITLTVIPSATT